MGRASRAAYLQQLQDATGFFALAQHKPDQIDAEFAKARQAAGLLELNNPMDLETTLDG